MKIKLILGSLMSIVVPVVTVISCSNAVDNHASSNLSKPRSLARQVPTKYNIPVVEIKKPNSNAARDLVSTYSIERWHLDNNGDGVENFAFKGRLPEPNNKAAATYWNVIDVGDEDIGPSPMEMLPKDIYNGCVAIMDEANKDATIADALGIDDIKSIIGDKSVVTAIITGDEFHVEFQKTTKEGATAESYLDSLDSMEVEKVSTKPYGTWMARVKFFEKNNGNPNWEWGKSTHSNYNIKGYPLYLVNMDFAQLGVTTQKMYSGQFIHITYNHTA